MSEKRINFKITADGKQAEGALRRVEGSFRDLKASSAATAKVLAGFTVAATGAMTYMVRESLHAADAARKSAQATGLTVEAYTGLQFAATQSGLEVAQLNTAMSRLNATLGAAASGGKEQQAVFRALGVSIRDASGNVRSGDAILKDLADRFAAMPDGVDKSAAAIKVFGRSGADMIPLLNAGSAGISTLTDQARALGLVISEETAARAEQFNDNLAALAAVARGAANVVAAELAPSLADLSDALVKFAQDGQAAKEIGESVAAVMKFIASTAIGAGAAVHLSGKTLAGVASIYAAYVDGGGLLGDGAAAAKRQVDIVLDDLEQSAVRYGNLIDSIQNVGSGQSRPLVGAPSKPRSNFLTNLAAEGAGPAKADPVEKQIQALQEQAATLGMTSRELALYKLSAEKATPAQLELAKAALDTITAFEHQEKTAKAWASIQDAINDETLTIIDSLKTQEQRIIESYEKRRQVILNNTLITGEEQQALLKRLHAQMVEEMNEVDRKVAETSEFWLEAMRSMQRAGSDFFFDAMQGNLDSFDKFVDSFKSSVDRMVADWLAAQAMMQAQSFFSAAASGQGVVGGLLNLGMSALGSYVGGFHPSGIEGNAAFVGPPAPGRAIGGPVSALTPYWVGEGGVPELFVPRTAGDIVPAGGGGVTVQMTVVTNDAQSFQSPKSQAQVMAAYQSALSRASRRNN